MFDLESKSIYQTVCCHCRLTYVCLSVCSVTTKFISTSFSKFSFGSWGSRLSGSLSSNHDDELSRTPAVVASSPIVGIGPGSISEVTSPIVIHSHDVVITDRPSSDANLRFSDLPHDGDSQSQLNHERDTDGSLSLFARDIHEE